MSSKAKKKPEEAKGDAGRPAGSPNRDYAVTQAIAPRCNKCDGTEFSPRQHVITRRHCGTAPDRKPYNMIGNYRHRCLGCGQWNVLILYQMIPEASEEAGYEEPGDGEEDIGT
jgi:hypothetical protein